VPLHNTDGIEMFGKSKHIGSVVLDTLYRIRGTCVRDLAHPIGLP